MPERHQIASTTCVLAFNRDENKYLFVSPDVSQILGVPPTDLYESTDLFAGLIHDNDRCWVNAQSAALAVDESVVLSYRIKTPDGVEKWVSDKRSLIIDRHTSDRVLLSAITDISAEGPAGSITSPQLLEDISFLFDNNPNPMWIYNAATMRIVKVNHAAIERYGYSEEEFLQMSPRDLRPPGEIEKYNAYVKEKDLAGPQKKGIVFSGVWKHQKKDGEVVHAEIICQDVKFEGQGCRVVVAANVTEKMRFEEELMWAKNSLEGLINNTDDQIWSVDRQTRYVYMNKAYRNKIAMLTGTEPKEGDCSYLHTGYTGKALEEWSGYYRRALNGERYTIINESVDPVTQQTMSFEISFNPIYNKSKNDVTGIGCFARNITQRLKTEKAIIDQNDRLRKIALLSSHELRRPVASMLGLINIMDKDNFYNPDNKEILEHLQTVGFEMDEVLHSIVDKTFTDDLPAAYKASVSELRE